MPDIFDQLTARQQTGGPLEGQPQDCGIEPGGDDGAGAAASLLELREQGAPGAQAGHAQPAPAQQEAYTPRELKKAVLELLKYGYLEAQRKANLYRSLLAQRPAAIRILEPLDFELKVDEVRGLAYLAIAGQVFGEDDENEWNHPLVRRQRFTLEQSLLLAILRQQFAAYEQQAGVGAGEALIPIDDLLPQLKLYLGELGSDVLEDKRLRNALEVLKGHGLVSEIDEHERVVIRPMIAHVANPENLGLLLQALQKAPQRELPLASMPAAPAEEA